MKSSASLYGFVFHGQAIRAGLDILRTVIVSFAAELNGRQGWVLSFKPRPVFADQVPIYTDSDLPSLQ